MGCLYILSPRPCVAPVPQHHMPAAIFRPTRAAPLPHSLHGLHLGRALPRLQGARIVCPALRTPRPRGGRAATHPNAALQCLLVERAPWVTARLEAAIRGLSARQALFIADSKRSWPLCMRLPPGESPRKAARRAILLSSLRTHRSLSLSLSLSLSQSSLTPHNTP